MHIGFGDAVYQMERSHFFTDSVKALFGRSAVECEREDTHSRAEMTLLSLLRTGGSVDRYVDVHNMDIRAPYVAHALEWRGVAVNVAIQTAAHSATSNGVATYYVNRCELDHARTFAFQNSVSAVESRVVGRDRIHRPVNSVCPGISAAENSEFGTILGAIQDNVSHREGLYLRLLCMADYLALGGAPIAINPGANALTDFWPNAPNTYNAAIARAANVLSGAGCSTFLDSGSGTRPCTLGASIALYCCGLARCGIPAGHPYNMGYLCTQELPVTILGGRRPAGLVAGAYAVIPQWIEEAIRFVLACTGDVEGLARAIITLAGQVRFEGPEWTQLPVPILERSGVPMPGRAIDSLRLFFHFAHSLGRGAWDPEIDGLLGVANDAGAAPPAMPARVPPPVGTVRFAGGRELPAGLWNTVHTAAAHPNFSSFERSLSTLEARELLLRLTEFNISSLFNEVPPYADAHLGTLRSYGDCDLALPACGVLGSFTIECTSGLAQIISDLSAKVGPTMAWPVVPFSGAPFSRRLYTLALLIRSYSDSLASTVRLSKSALAANRGDFGTGDAALDDALQVLSGHGLADFPAEDFYSTVMNCAASHFDVVEMYAPAPQAYYPCPELRNAHILPIAFHPAARSVIVAGCDALGGIVRLSNKAVSTLQDGRTLPWCGKDGLVSVGQFEIAGLLAVAALATGNELTFGILTTCRDPDNEGIPIQARNSLPYSGGARPSDQFPTHLTVASPACWWMCPGMPGVLRLQNVSVGRSNNSIARTCGAVGDLGNTLWPLFCGLHPNTDASRLRNSIPWGRVTAYIPPAYGPPADVRMESTITAGIGAAFASAKAWLAEPTACVEVGGAPTLRRVSQPTNLAEYVTACWRGYGTHSNRALPRMIGVRALPAPSSSDNRPQVNAAAAGASAPLGPINADALRGPGLNGPDQSVPVDASAPTQPSAESAGFRASH